MSYYFDSNHYLFVIDTNKYAGNFERPMCGYMTGDSGEYGDNEADAAFAAEVDNSPLEVGEFEDSIVAKLPIGDDNPHLSPSTIYPNPRWFNTGLGGEYRWDEPDVNKRALEEYRKRVAVNAEEEVFNAERWGWKPEAIERERKKAREAIDKANALTEPRKYPAYRSVAIFLESRPTPEQIEFLKARAQLFTEYSKTNKYLPDDLVIEGFRLVHVTVQENEEEV